MNELIVKLPSLGKVYKGKIPSELEVSSITTRMEKEIFAASNKKTIVDSILEKCIKTKIDVELLVEQDKDELLRNIRMVTYGRKYTAEVRCKNVMATEHESKSTFEAEIDLGKVEVRYLEDESLLKREIELEVSGDKIILELLDGDLVSSAKELAKEASEKNKTAEVDELEYYIIALAVKSVNGNDKMGYMKTLDYLLDDCHPSDYTQIYTKYTEINDTFGANQVLTVECTDCGHKNKILIPKNREFFRPQYRVGRGTEIKSSIMESRSKKTI